MDRQRIARELVAIARELAANEFARPLLKLRDGKRTTLKLTVRGLDNPIYAHIWFDADVATDDFGRPAKESGEWQVIFSDSENWYGGKELARNTFRYVEGHMRDRVAAMAADWIKKQLRYVARKVARTATMGDELLAIARELSARRWAYKWDKVKKILRDAEDDGDIGKASSEMVRYLRAMARRMKPDELPSVTVDGYDFEDIEMQLEDVISEFEMASDTEDFDNALTMLYDFGDEHHIWMGL